MMDGLKISPAEYGILSNLNFLGRSSRYRLGLSASQMRYLYQLEEKGLVERGFQGEFWNITKKGKGLIE